MSSLHIEVVSNLLQQSREYLTVNQIQAESNLDAEGVKTALRELARTGQIDHIAHSGRTPARYGWLASANPVAVAQPEIAPEDDHPPVPEEMDDSGHETNDPAPMVETGLPPGAYLLVVPKKKPRVMRSLARAQTAALSAVRNGAKRAEVFELTPVGSARLDAEWAYI